MPRKTVETMLDLMSHRGPDGRGVECFLNGRLILGHRRLSILDLSEAAHQPMQSPHGNWITFNGEIYNYLELRKQLASKHNPTSSSDTQVLIDLLDQKGHECLSSLNGMWAFVYYHTESNRLLVSRDRFGIKPLYWYEDDEVLILSSEIKPILNSPWYTPSLNDTAVETYLRIGLVDGLEECMFAGIRRFAAASFSWLSLDSYRVFSSPKQFYRISGTCAGTYSTHDAGEEYLELFRDSVKLRMRSDVPVGTCLSGGLDSSSIYCCASLISSSPLHSFSSVFDEPGYDESPFFNEVLRQYPGNNHLIQPKNENLGETLKPIIYHLEEPSLAMGVFPQWFVMKRASEHVKVLLDGQGGDETLAGYDLYYDYHLFDTLLSSPLKFIGHYQNNPYGKYSGFEGKRVLVRNWLLLLLKDTRINNSFLKGKLLIDISKKVLPALLKYEDKIGMAFSIEARFPFLDHRLVDFVFTQPPDAFVRDGFSKRILRDAMKGILPEKVRLRTDKKGFPTPFETVLKKDAILRQYRNPDIKDEWKQWRHISFQIWRSMFFQ